LVATGPGDSILIIDDGLRRATILSPTLRYARSFSAPAWVSAVAWFPTGQLIFSGVLSKASSAGYGLHLLTSVGVPEKSFAESDRGFSIREPELAQRLIPAIRSDRFLAVTRYQPYAIEDWSVGGELRRRWQRPNTYFDDNPKRISGLAPFAYVQAAAVDVARELLLVLIRIPDKRWKQGLKPAPGPGGEQWYTIIDADLIYDSVLEVVDLAKEELVARTRFDEIYLGLVSSDELARLKEQSDGSYKLTLHRLALRGR